MSDRQIYVSITGLRLSRRRHAVRFWWHAVQAMRQAHSADGNLFADTRTINGVHHTLSAWRDQAAMQAYLVAGAHRRAMRAYPSIGTGATVGFLSDRIPDWDDVHNIWQRQGRPV